MDADGQNKILLGGVIAEFVDYQKNLGTWLLTGTQDHKMHLVPFSEHFPLDKKKFAGLYELFQKLDISDWGIGEERLVFQHDKMRFFTPICFEDVFSDHVRRFVLRDADIILNISNDYWSLSPVEGRQHGILALFRAVENQRPLLRSTSSGYTVYIDATGRIHPDSPEPYTAGYTVARVLLPRTRLTVYTRWGDWFPLFYGLAVLILIMVKTLVMKEIDIISVWRNKKGKNIQPQVLSCDAGLSPKSGSKILF